MENQQQNMSQFSFYDSSVHNTVSSTNNKPKIFYPVQVTITEKTDKTKKTDLKKYRKYSTLSLRLAGSGQENFINITGDIYPRWQDNVGRTILNVESILAQLQRRFGHRGPPWPH